MLLQKAIYCLTLIANEELTITSITKEQFYYQSKELCNSYFYSYSLYFFIYIYINLYVCPSVCLSVRYARSNEWVDLDQTLPTGSLPPRAVYSYLSDGTLRTSIFAEFSLTKISVANDIFSMFPVGPRGEDASRTILQRFSY